MTDGFLPHRSGIDRLQRNGDLDEFLSPTARHGISALINGSPHLMVSIIRFLPRN